MLARVERRYHAAMQTPNAPTSFGQRLRHWRQHRRLSQQELSHQADISTRHMSFLETDRAVPSREMVLRLAERLEVPLRERNQLLSSAGYAAMYRERPLDHPDMAEARAAVDLILRCHEPYPALAMDRHWNMVAANRMVPVFLAGIAPALLQPPVNVLRLSLHPQGLAPQIANLGQWKHHLFERLRQQIHTTGDATLQALLEELQRYDTSHGPDRAHLQGETRGVVMPFQLDTVHGQLNFISTVTIFGSPIDITLQEMALETFLPADATTAALLRKFYSQIGS
ncbi:MAG: helix-turn-helix transcriptional regulator [Rhodoferax sp.]|nr:helix-turn-helix transcriptional regulator [Rhodoferax sp.]